MWITDLLNPIHPRAYVGASSMKYLSDRIDQTLPYCVYITIYSGNQLPPFYIGKSNVKRISNGYKGSVVSMKYKDIWKSESKNNPHLFKTIIISTFEHEYEALQSEEKIHDLFDVASNPLYINMANSNKKFVNYYTKEYRLVCRERKLGTKHSEETKRKIGNIHRGKKLSQEHKNILKKRWSNNTERKIKTGNYLKEVNNKAVLQFTLDGIFIREFVSITVAAKEIGISLSSISSCLNGRMKTAKGFKWEFKS